MVAPMTAALTWTHTGHSAQGAGQLPPRLVAGGLCPKAWSTAAARCWGEGTKYIYSPLL